MKKSYGFIALLLGSFIGFFSWIFKKLSLGIGWGVGLALPITVGLLQRIRRKKVK